MYVACLECSVLCQRSELRLKFMSDGRCSRIDDDSDGRAVQGHLRAGEGEGRTLQIHFRPTAAARHASERKLAAASERVPRVERRAAHARYALRVTSTDCSTSVAPLRTWWEHKQMHIHEIQFNIPLYLLRKLIT